MPNGIDLILEDHRLVASLFEAFDADPDGSIIGQVVNLLALHDEAEQGALYPFALEQLGSGDDLLDRAMAAHSAVKRQIDHLKAQEGVPLVESFTVLRRLVEEHVADEEQNLLPALGNKATAAELDTLGTRILQAKLRGG